jgi:hypothetical protein
MSRYKYSSLDEAADEIRLVNILPGVEGSELVVDLHTACLRQNESPP